MSLQSPEFKYITQECLREWKSSNPSFRLPDPVPMNRFLYELCWAMIRGELPFPKCRAALDSVLFKERCRGGRRWGPFLDISQPGSRCEYHELLLTISGDHRIRLVKMAKSLVESSFVPARLLQERCEEEFLWEAELSKAKAQDLKTKEVRVNTRLLYEQTKFNLLQEESEGYAKLVSTSSFCSFGMLTIVFAFCNGIDFSIIFI
ncbi:THO complex subunit 2, partial [Ananas comosus]